MKKRTKHSFFSKAYHRRKKIKSREDTVAFKKSAPFKRLVEKISKEYGISQKRAGKLITKDIKHYSLYRRWIPAKTLNQIIDQEINRLQFSKAKERVFQRALNRRHGENRAEIFAKKFMIPVKTAQILFVRREKSFGNEIKKILQRFERNGQEITWFEAQDLAAKTLINKELKGRRLTSQELLSALAEFRQAG